MVSNRLYPLRYDFYGWHLGLGFCPSHHILCVHRTLHLPQGISLYSAPIVIEKLAHPYIILEAKITLHLYI